MACRTCHTIYPTANVFIKHECFKKAPVHQQKEQLDLFRGEIEDEFGLRPRKRRKTGHSSSLRPANSVVGTVPPLPSVEAAIQAELSKNALLPHTSGLSVLHESNHIGASAGVYDSSQPCSNPLLSLFDPLQHMLLTYVENMLTQPQAIHD